MLKISRALCAAVLALGSTCALAQAYPNKPVRLVVSFAPGGPADIVARLISQKLGEGLGQPVLVENRAGAGGVVATQQIAKGTADGYTVLVTTTAFAVGPSLAKAPGYDIEKDFAPVSLIASQPSVIVAYPGLNLNTLQEVMAAAKGGKLNFGTAGTGTTPHLAAEYLFRVLGKVDVTHIPYNGGGQQRGDPGVVLEARVAGLRHRRHGRQHFRTLRAGHGDGAQLAAAYQRNRR